MTTELTARIAKPSDRRDLIRLCRRSVGKHDYVIPRLETVIEKRGLLTVFSGNRLVAMSNFTRAIDDSAWLGMARTDPDFRGRGIAQFMQRKIANYVSRKGITTMRFWILASNVSSIRAAEKGNFKPVAEAMRISASLEKPLKRAEHSENLLISDSTRLNRQTLSKSPYLKKMHGFFCYRNCFAKMNSRTMNFIKDDIFGQNELFFILSKPVESYGEFSLVLGPENELFRRLVETAKATDTRELGGFIPYDPSLALHSRKHGFKVTRWGNHALIFEKKIGPG